MKTDMHNWEVADIVYALRLLADNLDKKPNYSGARNTRYSL